MTGGPSESGSRSGSRPECRLGLFGARDHPWPSVRRTLAFYRRSLGADFELVDAEPDGPGGLTVDAALHFSGSGGWRHVVPEHPPHPVLFALHGGPVLDQDFLWRTLGRLETTDVLLVNCTSDVELLSSMFVEDRAPSIVRLPLPVDPERFDPLPRDEARAHVPPAEEDLVLGFVARLLPQKGLHLFLSLLAEVADRLEAGPGGPTVRGLIVGDYWLDYPVLGYVTEGYQQWIGRLLDELGLAERISYFPAKLTDEQLGLCYSAMDVLVHPTQSLDENFGYAPIEAMACGTPVVGSGYGGLKDTVADGVTGSLMPTWTTPGGLRTDLDRGADDVLRLLVDPELRREMGRAGRERMRSGFGASRCAGILRSAVHEAIAAHRRGESAPVELVGERPRAEPSGVLPPPPGGGRRWEHYLPAAAFYAGALPPRPGPRSRLRLAAPIERSGNRVRLRDPAWPAVYELDPAEDALVRVLEPLQEPGGARDHAGGRRSLRVDRIDERIVLPEGCDPVPLETIAARLVEDGLLLCSEPPEVEP